MSKIHGTTVHVLRDMDLGGLLREYIFEYSDGYCTHKPTDIIRIYESDDICGMYVRYRLVDRKAKVGEKVIYYKDGKSDGFVTTCIGYNEQCNDWIDIDPYLAKGDAEETCGFAPGYYRVLEPLHTCDKCGKPLGETACSNQKGGSYCSVDCAKADDELPEATETSESVLDLLANLAHRVAELERKLGEMEVDLGTVEENIEMILDDIVTLDERTQPLVALVKAVKSGE